MFSEVMRRRASVLLCALVAFVTLFASGWAAPAQAATYPCSVGPSDISGLSFANAGDGSFQLGGVLTVGNISATSGGCNNLTSPTAIRPLVNGVATATLNQPVTNATSQGGSLMRTAAGEVQYRPPSPSFVGTDTFTVDNNNTGRVINVTVNVTPAPTPPSINAINPNQGRTSGGETITISGSGFTGTTSVDFGGSAASFTVNSDSTIIVTAPAHSAGAVDVVVTNATGPSSIAAASRYTYFAPPTVTAIAPTSGPTAGGTSVILTGTNFAGATSVLFDGIATTFTVNSATQITATSPSHAAGAINIQVGTPGGTSAAAQANQFTYAAAPTVTAVSPTTGPTAGGTTVVVTGTNLSGATAVSFGGAAATGFTVNSATQITATAPAGTGTVDIRVTTSGGTSATSAADQYTYVAAPTVTSISPTSGPTSGGTTVVITGTRFSGATAVTFGGTAATGFTVDSATQITATAPAGTGTVNIRVTTAGGTSATSAADQYTYIATPTVTSISPTSGPTAGGTTVVVNGTNLSGATAVTFGGTAASGFTVNSAIQITATAPAGAGTVDIRITTAGGTSATSAADQYTYIAAPTVTSISPTSGPTAGGTTVVVNGTNLSGATAVTFGGTAASGFTVNSATRITATAPAGAGTVDIRITTAGGTSATSPADRYTYIALPSVTSVSPAQGTTAGGQSITISGSGFTGVTGVNVGLASATGVTFVSDTQITATTPAGGAGAATVSVTTASGSSTTNGTYTYITPPTADAQSVTTAYQTARAITLQGTNATSYAYTQPAAGTGGVSGTGPNVTYTPAAGYSGTTSFTFTTTNGTGSGAPQSAPATVSITVTPAAPTVLTQPSDQVVSAGATATFSAAAFGSATVQWQETFDGGASWADIAGATATSYTTPATTTADNGKRFRAVFTNAGGTTNSNAATLTVLPPTIILAPTSLPNATVGAAYSQTLTASGGASPYTYAVTAGALPTGLSLSAGGVLSGTPTAGGSFTFTLRATDSSSAGGGPFSGSRAYSITVAAATVAIAPTTLPAGDVGAAYSQTVTASGGTAPYSYAVTAGALPVGVTLAANGALSGTPTSGGAFNFTVTATDGSTGSGPYSGSRAYTLNIAAPTVILTPATLPPATAGSAYSQTVTAGGGVAPYSYAVTAGSLPAGVTLGASGVLSGTPTTGGTFNFTITATDSATGSGPYAGSRAYALTVSAPTLTLAPTSLPGGQAGVTYGQTLAASGGAAPYSYAVTAGGLPTGLTLNASTGAIDGTPTAQGTFNFTVTATDSSGGAGSASVSQAYSVVIAAPTIVIAPASLPAGASGVAYSQTLSASGGTAPYAYTISAGALPVGLSLSSSGALSGTPTVSGSFNFTVTATDATTGAAAPYAGAQAYTLVIGAPTITVDTAALPAATVAVAYSQTVTASGGTAPYSYVVTAGALPAGVSLSPAGVLSGAPTQGGAFAFTVTATDSSGGSGPFSGSRALTLAVNAPSIAITPTTLPNGQFQTAYSQALSASGGVAPYAFAVTAGALPAGVTLSSAGVVSGTPTVSGTFNFSVTATDASGGTGPFAGTQAYALVIAAPAPPVASNVSATVNYGSTNNPVTAALSGGTADSVAVASGPAHGAVTINGLGFLYTPAANYSGADSFTYTASNSGGASAPATVSLTVTAPPPPTVTPPAPVVVPPASGGGSAPVSVDLGARTQGVTDGYRVTTNARFGSSVISTTPATTPQGSDTFALVYTPAANFIGTDTVTVVAFGPGGDSAPATFTFQVAGKAPDLSGSVASSGTLTVSPTATLVGGPFQALRITRQPAFGTATVQGLNIVFTPGVANGGTTSLDYVIDLPFGSSAAGRLDLTVGQVPASQALVADTVQGHPVTVRISNAAGGPFTGAAVASISPTTAGSAAIAGTGGTYDLTFTPQGTFSGQAVVSFTLTNASGTSTGTLTVTVAARPDPSLDPDVRGVASGQVTAARRFSDTQVDNFQRRLESLRNGSNGSRNGLSLNVGGVGGQDDRDPRVALRRQLGQDQRLDPGALDDDRDRDMLGRGFGSDRVPPAEPAASQTGQLNAAPAGQGTIEGGRSVGVWTSGSVDWGRQDAKGLRDSRFATQGVTAGLDVRLNDTLIVGGGLGYGEDKTRIGDNGSTSRGKAATGALYASWRPAEGWFVEGVVGLSRLDFDSRRWVVGLLGQANGYADGERSGDVRFASASVGRTLRRQGLAADLYVRMEGRDIALDGFTETSGGLSALSWDALDQSGLSVNLGASWRWTLESRRFGALRPTARLEWSHELEDIETQGVRYVDWAASPAYLVPLDGWSRNALNLDLGAEWSLSDRLMLCLAYRGMLGDASTSHGGLIGLKYGW